MPHLKISDALSLFYTLHGDSIKPPALLIHGWCCDGQDWAWQIPFLTETHYVIVLDIRGHGKSSAPESIPYNIPSFVSDAAALLQHLNCQKDVLMIGHSMGAVIASAFAAIHPELTRAIVLVDPPYWNPGSFHDMILPTMQQAPNIHQFTLGFFQVLFSDKVPDWQKAFYTRRVEGIPGHVILGCYEGTSGKDGLNRTELHQELVKGKRVAPRLVVYADGGNVEKEKGLGFEEGRDEVIAIEGFGHWIHHVKSEEFNGILGTWLDRLEGVQK